MESKEPGKHMNCWSEQHQSGERRTKTNRIYNRIMVCGSSSVSASKSNQTLKQKEEKISTASSASRQTRQLNNRELLLWTASDVSHSVILNERDWT